MGEGSGEGLATHTEHAAITALKESILMLRWTPKGGETRRDAVQGRSWGLVTTFALRRTETLCVPTSSTMFDICAGIQCALRGLLMWRHMVPVCPCHAEAFPDRAAQGRQRSNIPSVAVIWQAIG